MTANHTSPIPNIIASLMFSLPSLLFYFTKLYLFLLLYSFIIVFILTSGLSNVKFQNEINKKID